MHIIRIAQTMIGFSRFALSADGTSAFPAIRAAFSAALLSHREHRAPFVDPE
jgi:hypothetical protein